MARTTAAKKRVMSSDEEEYDTSAVSAEVSPVPNSRKTARRTASAEEQPEQDKENSFVEHGGAAAAPATVKRALHKPLQVEAGTPTKRRLSARADDMRRQSFTNLRLTDAAGSSSASVGAEQPQASTSAAPPRANGRIAGLAAVRGRPSLAGLLPGQEGAAPVSRQAMTENYEEWMKMATDNKINATNTWNFALIDYFADMSLLRNTDDDGSINFQKASCTLDGCVKIWTSRVDSTATAVGKLISGLAEDNAGPEAEEGGGEQSDGEENQRRKKRTTKRTTATLAEDFSKIQQKQLDLEFTVDPLFRKTCADFDEGGASGILMNHLGCDANMRVVFDAGDCKMDSGDANDSDEELDVEDLKPVDISKLKAAHAVSLDMLDDLVICPTLASFKFSSDDSALDLDFFKQSTSSRNEQDAQQDHDMDEDFDAGGGGGQVDFFDDGPAEAGGSEGGAAEEDFFDADAGPDDDDDHGEEGNFVAAAQPARGQEDAVVSMAEGNQQGVFDYFDSALSKNWAGPEHWKMRRAPPAKKDDATGTTATRQRKEKQPFHIDFESPSDITAAELFAKPKGRAAPTVMKTIPEAPNNYLLPDDMHFSSSSLLRLFLKPKARINMRRRRAGQHTLATGPADINQDVDENYWAQAAQDAGGADFDAGGEDDWDDAPLPFSTQFLNDDDDVDMDVGDVGPEETPGADEEDDDLLAATQGQRAKRARPEYVTFAKRAKRVDVKRLKENIWKELDIKMLPLSMDDSMRDDSLAADPEDEPKTFTNVLTGLRDTYPVDKMDEISTSFCFICLLHLANENGLSIIPPGAMTTEEERVSDLTALNILRDQSLE